MRRNQIFQALEDRSVAFGSVVQMNCPEICELQSAAGLDFVYIDMEHGALGIEAVTNMIRAVQAGGAAASIIRVPDASPTLISRVLDAGAQGVLVPNVETAEQMSAAVRAAHFGPRGNRGACPAVRANAHGVQPWNEYAEWTSNNIFVCGIIETPLGLKNFDEIIAVEGVDAMAIGTFDLSVALGYANDYNNPAIVAKFEDLSAKIRAKGLELMGSVLDYNNLDAEMKRLKDADVRLVLYPGDRFLLSALYRSAVAGFIGSAAAK
jgi:4-hydroxy-2-oxoheptanedioate aldolase